MAVNNSLAKSETKEIKKAPFTIAIQGKGYQNLINNTLRDPKRAARFVTAITSAVSSNPALQECDAGTVLSAGLLGEGLNLSPSPQLGQYYIVPYKQKTKKDKQGNVITPERSVAQFQLGYKGYIQLAIRSGQYKKLNVIPVKDGELIRFNPLEEEIEVNIIEDETERDNAPTIGYYAMFEYINGFKKAMYWSKEKMISHADKYSAAFSKDAKYNKVSYADYVAGNYPPSDEWKYSSFWYKDFDGMACKTMLRQLISKWGIMSVEMETAITNDMGVIHEGGNVEYVENISETENIIETETVPETTETVTTSDGDDFSSIMEG